MNNAEYIKNFLNQHKARVDENNRIHKIYIEISGRLET